VVVLSLGEGDSVGTASELGGLAGASLELGSLGSGDLVGTAPMLGRLAGTSLLVVASGRRLVVRTATVGCVVAFASLVVGSTGGQDVVGAASKLSVQAASFLVGTVSRGLGIRTTSITLASAARAARTIRSAGRSLTIRTATVLGFSATLRLLWLNIATLELLTLSGCFPIGTATKVGVGAGLFGIWLRCRRVLS